MVILEPIQGENGVVVPPPGYLAAARRDHRPARRAARPRRGADRHRPHRALVRPPGRGRRARRGHPGQGARRRAADRRLPRPSARAADLLGPGTHGTTFGGNPVCCAAALAVLDTIAAEGLLDHVKRVGERLRRGHRGARPPAGRRRARRRAAARRRADRAGRRRLAPPRCAAAGFLVNAVQPDVLRLAPPLILTADQADAFLAALPAALDAASPPLPTAAPTPATTTWRGRMIRHFLRDDDLTPGRAGRGARPGRRG